MSFLDATGLGTFWSKLKNYFVPKTNFEAPVTGLSDILTPVNLLPNSDFSRSGGYPATQTITNLTGTNTAYIASNLAINLAGRGRFDGTVTKSVNSVRITGTLTTTNTVGHTIGLYYVNLIKSSNTFYTAAATIIDYNNNSGGVSLYSIGSSSAVYDTQGKDGQTYHPVFIRKTSNPLTVTSYYPYIFYPGQETGTTINVDIEFKDMRLYEGEFKNPPYTTSLDVKPSNQFMLSDRSNASDIILKSQNPVTRYIIRNGKSRWKFCTIHVTTSSGGHRCGYSYGQFLVYSYGATNAGFIYKYNYLVCAKGDGSWGASAICNKDSTYVIEPSTSYISSSARAEITIQYEQVSSGYFEFYISQTNASISSTMIPRITLCPLFISGNNVTLYEGPNDEFVTYT